MLAAFPAYRKRAEMVCEKSRGGEHGVALHASWCTWGLVDLSAPAGHADAFAGSACRFTAQLDTAPVMSKKGRDGDLGGRSTLLIRSLDHLQSTGLN